MLVVVAACSGGGSETPTTVSTPTGGDTASGTVSELVAASSVADFEAAARFAMPGQAALASLAEGASFADVAEALRMGDLDIAANFWAGFAQGANGVLDGDVDSGQTTLTSGGVEFKMVRLTAPDGTDRELLVREADGFRIDLFGSFALGLTDKMADPVERLLTTPTDDARLILTELQNVVPSLLAAADLAGDRLQERQQILTLVELITRVG